MAIKRAYLDRDMLTKLIYEKAKGESLRNTAAMIDGIGVTTLHRAVNHGDIGLDTLLILLGWLDCDVSSIVKKPGRQYEIF